MACMGAAQAELWPISNHMGFRCSPAAAGEAAVVAPGISRAAVHAGPPSKAVHGCAVIHVAALRAAVGEQAPGTSLLVNTDLLVGNIYQSTGISYVTGISCASAHHRL